MRSKNWVFTLNNPEGLLHPDADGYAERGVTFLTYQEEVGEQTLDSGAVVGTHHLQGYLEWKTRKTLSKCKELPGLERAHFEVRRGTQAEAISYANKDDTQLSGPYHWGVKAEAKQGRRNDLLDVKEKIDAGGTRLVDLFGNHFGPMVRYGRGIGQYIHLKTPPRDFHSTVLLFLGPSGTQKSTLSRLIAERLGSVYYVPAPKGSGLYYDNYDYQDVLFFDEFDGNVMTPTAFNSLCQPFGFTLPCHGAAGAQMRSKYIIICSNYHPAFWWKNRTADATYQTTRRIDGWVYRLLDSPSWRQRKRQLHPFAPRKPVAVVHGAQGRVLYDVGQVVEVAEPKDRDAIEIL